MLHTFNENHYDFYAQVGDMILCIFTLCSLLVSVKIAYPQMK